MKVSGRILGTMNLHVLPLPELPAAAAALVVRLSAQAVASRGRFTVALSGGSLPELLCPPLAAEPLKSQVSWPAWHVFWADERCVSLTSPESNYFQARRFLFDHVDIPPQQIYPPNVSLEPAETAAAYQATLERVFSPPAGQLPRFDLVLLGLGPDGHTASLFPHHPLLAETEKWVAAVLDSPKPPPHRITLTLPVINNARQIVFIAAGAAKANVLPEILGTENPAASLPARLVQPVRGEQHWFVDQAAAAGVRR